MNREGGRLPTLSEYQKDPVFVRTVELYAETETGKTEIPPPEDAPPHSSITDYIFYNTEQGAHVVKGSLDNLRVAVKNYNEENQEAAPEVFNGACSWTRVLAEMHAAAEMYKDKADRNVLRKVFRQGPLVSDAMLSLTEAVPDSDGIGLVKVGLLVIFNAIRHRAENRDKIFECFHLVPHTLVTAYSFCKVHSDGREMVHKVERLRSTLIEEIPTLINILLSKNKKGFPKFAATLINSDAQKIDKIVAKINEAIADLKECSVLLDQRNNATTARAVQGLTETTNDIKAQVGAVRVDVGGAVVEMKGRFDDLSLKVDKLDNMQTGVAVLDAKVSDVYITVTDTNAKVTRIESIIRENNKRDQEEAERMREENIQLRRVNKDLQRRNNEDLEEIAKLCDSWRKFHSEVEWRRERHIVLQDESAARAIRRAAQRHELRVSADDLIDAIADEAEHMAPGDDRRFIRQKMGTFDQPSLRRVWRLMELERFLDWASSPGCDVLLVDGHCVRQRNLKISPMSVFCAWFARSIEEDQQKRLAELSSSSSPSDSSPSSNQAPPPPPTIVLYFACAQHTSHSPLLSGPNGLIRSLISQLLYHGTCAGAWSHTCTIGGAKAGPDVEFLTDNVEYPGTELWEQVRRRTNADALFYTFVRLLRRLRQGTTVYCVVDGVSQYETSQHGWSGEIRYLVDFLVSYCCNDGTYDKEGSENEEPVRFKLLLASTTKSVSGYGVRDYIPKEKCVDLRGVMISGRAGVVR